MTEFYAMKLHIANNEEAPISNMQLVVKLTGAEAASGLLFEMLDQGTEAGAAKLSISLDDMAVGCGLDIPTSSQKLKHPIHPSFSTQTEAEAETTVWLKFDSVASANVVFTVTYECGGQHLSQELEETVSVATPFSTAVWLESADRDRLLAGGSGGAVAKPGDRIVVRLDVTSLVPWPISLAKVQMAFVEQPATFSVVDSELTLLNNSWCFFGQSLDSGRVSLQNPRPGCLLPSIAAALLDPEEVVADCAWIEVDAACLQESVILGQCLISWTR